MKWFDKFSKLDYVFLVVILVCFVVSLFVSCRSAKVVYVPVPGKDSVKVEVREKVVTVHDTAFVEIPAQKSEMQTKDSISYLETDFAESDARINADGSLYHSLRNKPQKEIPYEKEIVYVNKDSIVYQEKPMPYPVEKKLSRWEQIKMNIGSIALWGLIILTIFLVFKIAKTIMIKK